MKVVARRLEGRVAVIPRQSVRRIDTHRLHAVQGISVNDSSGAVRGAVATISPSAEENPVSIKSPIRGADGKPKSQFLVPSAETVTPDLDMGLSSEHQAPGGYRPVTERHGRA